MGEFDKIELDSDEIYLLLRAIDFKKGYLLRSIEHCRRSCLDSDKKIDLPCYQSELDCYKNLECKLRIRRHSQLYEKYGIKI